MIRRPVALSHVTQVRRSAGLLATVGLLVCGLLVDATSTAAAEPQAEPTPQWSILQMFGTPSTFVPGSKEDAFQVDARNIGGAATEESKQIVMSDRLPPGVKATGVEFKAVGGGYGTLSRRGKELETQKNEWEAKRYEEAFGGYTWEQLVELFLGKKWNEFIAQFEPWCRLEPAVVCEYPGRNSYSASLSPIQPGQTMEMIVHVEVEPGASAPLTDAASISGGGAGNISADTRNFPIVVGTEETLPFGNSGLQIVPRNRDQSEDTQAGGHPFSLTTSAIFHSKIIPGTNEEGPLFYGPAIGPVEEPHQTFVKLPPGVVANPQAVPQCKLSEFYTQGCPPNAQVGSVLIDAGGRFGRYLSLQAPVYNLKPLLGQPANLGFGMLGIAFLVKTKIDAGGDYSVSTSTESPGIGVDGFSLELWGVPAAEHTRGLLCINPEFACNKVTPPDSTAPPTSFLRLSTDCSVAHQVAETWSDSWGNFGVFTDPVSTLLAPPDGCNELPFQPSWKVHTTTDLADAPSGLDTDLHLPQNESPNGVATSDIKNVSLKLPQGVSLNPAAANGRAGCAPGEFGLHSAEPASCPNASKVGEAEVETPLQDHPLPGSVYLAKQNDNPFGSTFAIYVEINDPISATIIKMAGEVRADPQTGQLTTTFHENPQLPQEDFKLHLFGGAGGILRTPAVCGSYDVASAVTPYSAPEAPATPSTTFNINGSAHGNCPQTAAEVPQAPVFHAGTVSPQAGAYSPFAFKLVREDGTQEFARVETSLPQGLLGKLAGLSYCPDAAIGAASDQAGTQERANPSCPAASEVGTVDIGTGAGPDPLYVRGHAYLTGPYKGAPLGLAVITPAVAGPYDLGTTVVRVALYVDPETTQIRAVSDRLPTILDGVPLDIRSIALKLDRPQFTLNPTSCEEMGFTGSAFSIPGAVSPLSQRFQVGGCETLPFKPHLGIHLKGNTKHLGHPALRAVLMTKSGEANSSSVQVTLPSTEQLDQSHIVTVCTRVRFAAGDCPPGSILGRAVAKSPLLDAPLSGPVFLRSSSHELPDLVADLQGQIRVVLVGRIDSVHGGIRTTFGAVPDAPVSKFVLQLQGGKKGLLENTTNICASRSPATVFMEGHNGKVHDTEPMLQAHCHGGAHRRHHHGHGRSGHQRTNRHIRTAG